MLQALHAWAEDGKAVVVLSTQADGQTYVGGAFPLVDGQVVLDLSCITSEGVTTGAGYFTGTVNVGFDGQPTPRDVDMGTISLAEFARQLTS